MYFDSVGVKGDGIGQGKFNQAILGSKMSSKFKSAFFRSSVMVLLMAVSSVISAQSFSGVVWSVDKSNTPEQDKSGKGTTPSTSGATDNRGSYTFQISTSSTSGTQRQEFKYERRDGYNWMSGKFKLSTEYSDFDKIALAQTHDDKTDSQGVFSIYQVRKDGGDYVFGVQGDTTEADNGYSKFATVKIELGEEYSISIKTHTNGIDGSYETATLYNSSGTKIWQETIVGGGDSEQYKKVGVYKLSEGKGPVEATWRSLKFYTGTK